MPEFDHASADATQPQRTENFRTRKPTSRMKTVAVFGTDGGVSWSARGAINAHEAIGLNTGNALFQFALWDMIRNPKFLFGLEDDPNWVRENADLVLIPSANQLTPGLIGLEHWADYLDQVGRPCVAIGLGAEAPLESGPDLPLSDNIIRYAQVLASRCSNIGVRGPFTMEVLKSIGITNAVVTGCPSHMINGQISGKSVAESITRLRGRKSPRIGYLFGYLGENERGIELAVSRLAENYDHQVICQSEIRMLKLIHDGTFEEDGTFEWILSALGKNMSASDYRSYLRTQGIFYSDARSWIDAMNRFDLVIGMRIHGAIAAIQGGTLGICIPKDLRTSELVETMAYPYLPRESVSPDMAISDVLEQIRFDPSDFDRRRSDLFIAIRTILEDAGCVISSHYEKR